MTTRQQKTVAGTLAAIGALALLGAHQGSAQREPTVTATTQLAPATVKRGATATLTVAFTVRDGYHINSVTPGNPDVIAAKLAVTAPKGVTVGKAVYPTATTLTLPGMTSGSQVYEGKQTITVPLQIAKTAKPGRQTVSVTWSYQACNATSCLPPDSVRTQATLTIQ